MCVTGYSGAQELLCVVRLYEIHESPGCCHTGAPHEQHCDDVMYEVSVMAMLLLHYDYAVAAAMAASVSQERAGVMAAMPARRG